MDNDNNNNNNNAEARSSSKHLKEEEHEALVDEARHQTVEETLSHLRSSLLKDIRETDWMYSSSSSSSAYSKQGQK